MAKNKSRQRSRRKQKTSVVGFILKWTFVAGLWIFIFLAGLTAWYATELPDITQKATFERKTAITIKAADGSVITRYGEVVGETVSAETLPPHLINAVLATEDRRFYDHFGIDPLGLVRAMFVNVTRGRLVQGGSTITQQLAKNLFLSHERTIKRKIQEAVLALWLEYELTKDEILSAYLNRVYMGSGAYGVDAAARLYFDKDVNDISLREAATLAGLLKAPSRYSPLNNPGLSKQRADIVLTAMVDAGYLNKNETEGLIGLPPRPTRKPSGGNASRYFTDWIVDGLDDLIGTPEQDLIIETTFDPALQNMAETALRKTLMEHGESRAISQGAILVMRPDGKVLAMVGGRDYALSQFNRAVQAQRPPGSSFKPVVYLTALEQGWRPHDRLIDEPFQAGKYRPSNFKDEYYGEVTLIEALTNSLNSVAVKLMQSTGVNAVRETARRLGIFSPLEQDLSLALGSSGVSLLEMTTAYAVFSNGGLAVFPYAITKIEGADGTLYYQRPQARPTRRVIEPYHLADLTAMMQNVVLEGTGRAARLPRTAAAGKTGTSQNSRDAWFIGFTDTLVAGVWLGNDDNSPMKGVTGGSFPAQIWHNVMVDNVGRYDAIRQSNFSQQGRFTDLLNRLIPANDWWGRNDSAEEFKRQNAAPRSSDFNQ